MVIFWIAVSAFVLGFLSALMGAFAWQNISRLALRSAIRARRISALHARLRAASIADEQDAPPEPAHAARA